MAAGGEQTPVRLRSYFAGSVEAAIALAAREIGEEAMLVYSREASPEARHLGRYEVVFSLPAAGAPEPPRQAAAAESWMPAFEQIREEIRGLRTGMEKLAARGSGLAAPAPRPPDWNTSDAAGGGEAVAFAQRMETALAASGVAPEWICRTVGRWSRAAAADRPETWDAALRKVLAEMVPAAPGLGDAQHCVAALIGPPGAGKTSALVKLAARYGPLCRRPAELIHFDNCRIAAAEQLRTFAAILGVGFQSCETAGAVMQALEEHRHKGLVMIDTPGLAAGEREEEEELARLFAARPAIEVHLALPASMNPADLSRVADRFVRFRPSKLLFTRLDETSTFGPSWTEAARLSLPVSFLSDGQRIPEDLREATPQILAGLLLGEAFACNAASPAGGPDTAAAAA